MKIFKIIICIMALCLLVVGCEGGDDVTDTADTTPADAETTTPAPAETTPAPAVKVDIAVGGKTEYKIIRSDKSHEGEIKLFVAFFNQLKEKTGADFGIAESFDRETVDPDAKEILLGSTNRPESAALAEKLSAAGGSRYGIAMTGNKLAIVGTGTYQCYLALDHVLTRLMDGADLSLEEGFEYISEDNGIDTFDLDTLIAMDKGMSFVNVGTLISKIPPKVPGYSVMQGGGSDGKHAYVALINKKVTPEHALIYKYDMETLKLVKVSEPIPTCHTNDITYDSKNHRLVISRCTAEDGYLGLCFVNPDTLELIETKTTAVANRAVDYIPETDQYVLASNWTLTLTDADFNAISAFTCNDPQYTTQGCYTDGKYIYDVRYVSGSKVHYNVVHTLDGKYVGTLPVYGLSGTEPENMFFCNGKFVMGCNKTNSLYELELLPDNWW